jgi:type IV pilus secretin PilQ/predicted competence protein
MRRLRRGIVLLVLTAACGPVKTARAPETPPTAAETPTADAAAGIEVRDVRVEPVGAGRRVTIVLSREADGVQGYPTSKPPRLVVDVAGPLEQNPMPVSRFPLTDPVVSQVRVGSHDGALRAVLDLAAEPRAHAMRKDGNTVVVDIGDVAAAAADAPTDPAPGAVVPTAEVHTLTGDEDPYLAVRDVHVERAGAGRRLVIGLSRTPDRVRHFVLPDPPRLVMDVTGPLGTQPILTRFAVQDDVVTRVRVANNGKGLRLVADLKETPADYAVQPTGASVVAALGDVTPVADAGAGGRVVHALATAPADDELVDGGYAAKPAAFVEKPVPVAEPEPVPPHVEPVAEKHRAEPAPEPMKLAEAAPEAPAEVVPPPPPVQTAAIPPARPAHHMREAGLGGGPFTGQRISLDFKDADIQNVLRVLADVSQLNIIATDDVKGKVTLHLTDVPWDQALDLVMRSNRLEMTREGNVVRISTVARLKEEREALRAAEEAETELEPLRVQYVKVNYARADESLVDKVKGVLTDRGSVTFDDRTNTVIVRDISRGIADAANLIRELDVQSPQVLIEANIVEATEDFARGLGVQWGYRYNAGPQTGNPTGMNFPGTVGIGGSGLGTGNAPVPPLPGTNNPLGLPFMADFPVPANFGSGFGTGNGSALDMTLGSLDGVHSLTTRLTALEEAGKAKIISRPRVITMNNVAATIQSLTILRVKLPGTGTIVNTAPGGAAGSATNATEKINTGITLVVTPQISSDGYVLMNIYAKSSQPDFTRTVDNIPNEVSREANSNVLIRDGETVVLGGIFRNTSQDNEAGLPYLRSIPVLGWLFKRNLRATHHEELLVFLSPKIVSAGTAALPAADQLWQQRSHGG